MSSLTLEQRVAELESQLTKVMKLLKTERPPATNWIDRLTGSISNDELFAEALEYGRAFRVSDQPEDETA